jgi:hypothetical protein
MQVFCFRIQMSGRRWHSHSQLKMLGLARKSVQWLSVWLQQTVYRRIEWVLNLDVYISSQWTEVNRGVKSVKSTMTRNITALFLLSVLVILFVWLLLGVCKSIWPYFYIFVALMQSSVPHQENDTNNSWDQYSVLATNMSSGCKFVPICPSNV